MEDFLKAIWNQSEGDTVFLPYMDKGVWNEGQPYHKKGPLPKLPIEVDKYFTPLTYTGSQRRKGFLGKPGVIFADLDGDHVVDPRLKPTAIVSTSPGHYHAYWFLTEPADPKEWERAAKGWTKEIGADPGGWDATQVLRVPSTLNLKRDEGFPVTLVSFRPDRKYELSEFPKAQVHSGSVLLPEPLPSKTERDSIYRRGIADDSLPLSARYWLTITEQQVKALGRVDRSAVMWEVEKSLISSGFTVYEVFQLMYWSGINKWRGRPDRLGKEVNKAAS